MLLVLWPVFVVLTVGMYDLIHKDFVSTCEHGCALWSDLASDGNTRDQKAVDAKWKLGKAPLEALRNCAMPANDPSPDPAWCYCKDTHDSSYAMCTPPIEIPSQVNVQVAGNDQVVIQFVTFEGSTGSSSIPVAKYGLSPSSISSSAKGFSTDFHDVGVAGARDYSMHYVVLSVQPSTRYYYQVSSGTPTAMWSDVYSFVTLPPVSTGGNATRLIIFGDMGVYSYNNMDHLLTASQTNSVDFIVHLGDHGYNMASSSDYRGDGYLSAMSPILSSLPWAPTIGNHEYYEGAEFHRWLNMTYGISKTAGESCSSKTSRYYSFNVGITHFIILDMACYYFGSEKHWCPSQVSWLEQDLMNVNRTVTPWIVQMGHYPLYCSSITLDGEYPDGTDENSPTAFKGCTGTGEANVEKSRKDLEPLMLKYGVDIYLCGHEHNYESIWPTSNNAPVQKSFLQPKAPVHVVTGAGGPPGLDKFGDPGPWTRKQISDHATSYMTITNETHLTLDTYYNSNGKLLDTFTIIQNNHGPFA